MARWWKRPPVGAAGVGPTPLRYVATPRIAIPPIVCRVLDRHKMLSAYMALRTLWFVGAADDDMAAGKDLIQQSNQDRSTPRPGRPPGWTKRHRLSSSRSSGASRRSPPSSR